MMDGIVDVILDGRDEPLDRVPGWRAARERGLRLNVVGDVLRIAIGPDALSLLLTSAAADETSSNAPWPREY